MTHRKPTSHHIRAGHEADKDTAKKHETAKGKHENESAVEIPIMTEDQNGAPAAAEDVSALLAEKEKERQAVHDQLLRTMADFDNFKKRIAREKNDLVRYGNEKIAREILPVIDNFERAVRQAESDQYPAAIREGIEMILKQLLAVLEKYGVKDFISLGQPFDPTRHEAMVHQESTEHDENTVISEFQKGYFLHDKLLRPALVAVAKRPSQEEENEVTKDATVH